MSANGLVFGGGWMVNWSTGEPLTPLGANPRGGAVLTVGDAAQAARRAWSEVLDHARTHLQSFADDLRAVAEVRPELDQLVYLYGQVAAAAGIIGMAMGEAEPNGDLVLTAVSVLPSEWGPDPDLMDRLLARLAQARAAWLAHVAETGGFTDERGERVDLDGVALP